LSQLLKRKNILVTGGAGFIGCALASRLASQSHRFLVVDNLLSVVHPSAERPKGLHEKADLVVADITEKATWPKVLSNFKPDVVIHLAAETATGRSLKEASKHALTNVVGFTQLLDALVLNEVLPEHIVLASSRAVYGEGAWQRTSGEVFYPGQRTNRQLSSGQWDFEGKPLASVFGKTRENPTSVYGSTKLAQENLLRSWAYAFSVPFSILRLQNVYGPGQSPFNPYTGVVILFSQLARRKGQIELYEDGLITRDLIYVDDAVDALVNSIAEIPATGCRQLDIGTGVSTTLLDLAQMITDFYDAPPAVICGKFRDGDVRHAGCDISAAIKELSWQPKWSLSKGLKVLQNHLAENDCELARR
jgi:dTDP-L-rhamnose 4-epimerase